MRFFTAALAAGLLLILPSTSRATPVELELAAGSTAYASTWRGDFGGGGTLRLGTKIGRVFALEFQGWESMATVDRRLDTGLSFGVAGYLPLRLAHPYARGFFIHQHEEGLVSVENAFAGVVAGIGAGIRHRAGAGLSLGVEVPLKRSSDGRLTWTALGNVTGVWFPDVLGPTGYVGLDLGVGLDFLL